jgi:hypothetical protein
MAQANTEPHTEQLTVDDSLEGEEACPGCEHKRPASKDGIETP